MDRIKKPWYFLSVFGGWIIEQIIEYFLNHVFSISEGIIIRFLNIRITVLDLIPCLIAAICCLIYIQQLHKEINKTIYPEDTQKMFELLSEVLNKNEYVESIQAYQYQVKNDKSGKYIKLNYVCGVADERIEINSIMQTYFYFPYSIYKKICAVSGYYGDYKREKDPIKKEHKFDTFREEGEKLAKELLDSLKQINTSQEIEEYHCEMYRVALRILSAIQDKAVLSILNNKEVEQTLIKRKKTGILGSVVLSDMYVFRNQNSLEKTDRLYITMPFDKEKNIVLLASLTGSNIVGNNSKPNENDLEKYCIEIGKQILEYVTEINHK